MKKPLTILCLVTLSPYSYSDNRPLELNHSIISKTITNNAVALRERALSDNLLVDEDFKNVISRIKTLKTL